MRKIATAIRCNRLHYKETLSFMSQTETVTLNLGRLELVKRYNRDRLDEALNRDIKILHDTYILQPEYRGDLLSKMQEAKDKGWEYITYKYVNQYTDEDAIIVSIRYYTDYPNFMLTGKVTETSFINEKVIAEYNMFMSENYSDEYKEKYGDVVENDEKLYEKFQEDLDLKLYNERIDSQEIFGNIELGAKLMKNK